MVLLVGLEMLREQLNLLRQRGDLDLRRSRVALMALEFGADCGFVDLHFVRTFCCLVRPATADPTRCARTQVRTSAGTGGRPQRGEISLDGRRKGKQDIRFAAGRQGEFFAQTKNLLFTASGLLRLLRDIFCGNDKLLSYAKGIRLQSWIGSENLLDGRVKSLGDE